MFYGLKVFQSVCSLVFGNWLTSIGPDNAKMVKQIRGYATDLVRSDRVFALSLASGHASVSVTGDPKGYQVGDGVFRAPFKDPERPEMIMWTTASSSVIYASKDDQHTVSMFKVESDAPLKLVPM
ncbi:hypothetical protein CLAFUW4_11866 [Fulvia fulva]|uniref:Uncharacterized protein n=1 Tax=Passalora fulva TaxID=5499 RepID=A0A9Q8USZ1_PASFU|nr:uncharacterized protein CLAFUR5_10908 [Fulvia fulva]KAK4617961.1 hypothetical protein CLAFUR4_11871 [Fulvia fulva]KAK4618852.1 hypothetical protein CLAFUR0_11884 [Fulvia fulva]UJO21250.1 hypothetical protein CLAFUR5_10908 [Fulvia fulva]WPV18657.1 hypothetical protein CLAFUW4_11866 [Fulvia fulva]WPV33356.1 hypothetical protein CLAFUW7_11873 [Fulvia fulva]